MMECKDTSDMKKFLHYWLGIKGTFIRERWDTPQRMGFTEDFFFDLHLRLVDVS
jgi:hypothetical protein